MSRGAKVKYVYFVRRADGEGPVKIGCSVSPPKRLMFFTGWVPYPLTLLAQMEGDHSVEAQIHVMFAHQHSHAEWFYWSPELGDVIEQVRAGTFDVDQLPQIQTERPLTEHPKWSEARKAIGRLRRELNDFGRRHGWTVVPAAVRRASRELFDPDPKVQAANVAAVRRFLDLHVRSYREAA